MDLGVTMSAEVLEDKLEEARERGRREATWNTKRLPSRLTPGWTNRLFVACAGRWVGYFPLSGDVLWNPDDASAPYALIFDAARWMRLAPIPTPRFRGWRYLDSPPGHATPPTEPSTALPRGEPGK